MTKKPRVSLSDHFTLKKIFFQVITPILMMVFTSVYGIIDGLFVSNFDGEDALAAVNLIYPLVMVVGGLGFMFGSGGSALTGKLLGEKNKEEANKVFTMVFMVAFILGIVVSIVGFFLVEPVSRAMATVTEDVTETAITKAISYGRILMLGQSLFMIQSMMQNFFVVGEKQNLGFIFTLAAGLTNMFFDFLFVGVFKWRVEGAAIATIIGYAVGSIGPVLYFLIKKNGLITFVKTGIKFKPILKSITNGFSDFVFTISSSVTSIVYNIKLLQYFGQNGVSAYGITMYVSFFFVAVFIGYVIGMGPVISYNYGAQNHNELKNVIKKSFIILTIVSILMLIASILLAKPLSLLFLSSSSDALELSTIFLMIFSTSLPLTAICIFLTAMFTSLNNGLISGLIAFFRTLIFAIACALLLPLIFNSGYALCWANTVAEILSIIMSLVFYFSNKKKYHY